MSDYMTRYELDTIGFNKAIKILQECQKRYKHDEERFNMTQDEIRKEFQDKLDFMEQQLKCSLYQLTPLEKERFNAFRQKHYRNQCHNSNRLTIHTTANNIGVGYVLECPVCHEQEDITDEDSW